MATIKSYTNLEQSKKLAEILPLESADMYYFDDNGGEPKFKVRNGITYYYDSEDYLCCWSLVALLSVLPEYHLSSLNPLSSMYCCRVKEVEIYANNQVDACVAMIEKLHELKML